MIFQLIKVDITRGNLDPLPIAVSPLHVEKSSENLEKLEYIGYSLEKFYETKKATFYLFDYEGITKI